MNNPGVELLSNDVREHFVDGKIECHRWARLMNVAENWSD
jgi:hypothetical protein